MDEHHRWMEFALQEAGKALREGEVPIGAVVVRDDRLIGRGRNQVERLKDPTAHAEILAIRAASQVAASWRLLDCTLYVTLEPCAMCAGGIVLARLKRLVFGAFDPKSGACGSVLSIVQQQGLNHHVEVVSGVLEVQCGSILKSFFGELR